MDNAIKSQTGYAKNNLSFNEDSVVMYIDMNSYFASCEQQDKPELRNRPIGVLTYDSPNATVIAPSIEAKQYGVKTGMRFNECKELCPHILPVLGRPSRYREFHIRIMMVLNRYCDDVLPKSIDEAVMNFTSYRLIYKDFKELALKIKDDIRKECGEYIKCSIGIASNAFLSKLATEVQKPDGLIEFTKDNVDGYLKNMKLTDLPGIAKANERRLVTIGIRTPLEMKYASQALLRKAFGGVVGNYWHKRLNSMEVDMYKNGYKGMSAGRSVSRQQRENRELLESLLISLCTRLEQRMVKQESFCQDVSFTIKYRDSTKWETKIKLANPTQDAMEIRKYIKQKISEFEQQRKGVLLFNSNIQHMGVAISRFVSSKLMQYTLFDNSIRRDTLRKTMYQIKDEFGKDVVRKASETINPNVMRDAIGFGSVKDMYEGNNFNQYLLEQEEGDRPVNDNKHDIQKEQPLIGKHVDDFIYENIMRYD